jgi:glycosyltransferase involved in cell wall biosynthesis
VRVVHASKAYFPHLGGIETVVRQVAEDQCRRGGESTVVVTHSARQSTVEILNGVRVVRVAAPRTVASLPLALGYPGALAKAEGDVLIVHEPSLLPALSQKLRPSIQKRFGRSVVWWHSDVYRQRLVEPFYGPVLRSELRNASAIIAATPHHISSSSYLQSVSSKVEVVPYGIRLDDYVADNARKSRVASLRSESDGLRIVAVGRLVPYKGHRLLLDAVSGLDNVTVTIVGDGPERERLAAHPLHKQGRLALVSSQSAESMIDYLHSADVFAFPSIHVSEAFGISQVEAMACGKPVVCFNLPTGVSWVNDHGGSGLVVPLGNVAELGRALQLLAENPSYREDLGSGARERASRLFDERITLQAVHDITQSVGAT